MRVVVTRPQPAADRTAAELERRGHAPVLLPLMTAEHDLEGLSHPLSASTVAVVVTSAEALRALARLPPEIRRDYLSIPLYAVGQATAEAARRLGFARVIAGEGDGKALAQRLLSEVPSNQGALITYLAGDPRTPDLEETLQSAGRPLTIRQCYRMISIEPDREAIAALAAQPPDVVLLYSSETVRRFLKVAEITRSSVDWSQARFICLSAKIASLLPEPYGPRATWPEEPREDLLIDLLTSMER
ncbi:uroporphyrinogen-III synthase [Rhizobium sp. G187]|uniref:uroporphyrinogen-III synthase n=1 Tax=Rhizobium sp. G187 TaxID=3451352 RepID=UPI003EE5718B